MKVFAPEFEISVTGGLTWARVAVVGELDVATAPELDDILARERRSGRTVTLDLSAVAFLDSTGLSVVLRAMRDAQENGWNFGIAAALSEPVLRTVRVAGVLPMLPLVEEE